MALLATFRVVPLLLLRLDVRASLLPTPLVIPLRILLGGGPVNVPTNAGGVPGQTELQSIAGGISWWALILSLVGLLIGAATWAIGSHSSNYQFASAGRRAVVASGLAAMLVGAAPTLVNWFYAAGQHVK